MEFKSRGVQKSVPNMPNPPPPPPKQVYKDSLIVSTGSTLLDLAIYGGRAHGGGVPGGIIIEVFSEYGLGKTAIASSICGNSTKNGGDTQFRDPEGRLDREYAELYGVSLSGEQYSRVQMVNELFDDFMAWDPPNKNVVNAYVVDSIAALSTTMEMGEKGDKMGMRKAKEISTGLRKASIIIAEGHKIIVFTNQLREGDKGKFTPGGRGVPYWASVRLEVKPINTWVKGITNKETFINETVKVGGRDIEKIIGINTIVTVVKNSRDDPWRQAPVSILFKYGIDDIKCNLQYLKSMRGLSSFDCSNGKTYVALNDAIHYVEKNSLEEDLKEQVIDLWNEIEEAFQSKHPRKKKI